MPGQSGSAGDMSWIWTTGVPPSQPSPSVPRPSSELARIMAQASTRYFPSKAPLVRPLIPMMTTGEGMGRPVIDIAGRDPQTWRAAFDTAENINARAAAQRAARDTIMNTYMSNRPAQTSTNRPIIQTGINAGPSVFGRISRGGARLFGR